MSTTERYVQRVLAFPLTDEVRTRLAELPEHKAHALDQRIRAVSERIVSNIELLLVLLDDAAEGQVDVTLGFDSWREDLNDAVQMMWKKPHQPTCSAK